MVYTRQYKIMEIKPGVFKVSIKLDNGTYDEYISHDLFEILTYAEMLLTGVFIPQTTFDDDCDGREDISGYLAVITNRKE